MQREGMVMGGPKETWKRADMHGLILTGTFVGGSLITEQSLSSGHKVPSPPRCRGKQMKGKEDLGKTNKIWKKRENTSTVDKCRNTPGGNSCKGGTTRTMVSKTHGKRGGGGEVKKIIS